LVVWQGLLEGLDAGAVGAGVLLAFGVGIVNATQEGCRAVAEPRRRLAG
jgi:hypothetical protein